MTATAEQSWTTRDKSDWPRGPWDNEPDKIQWVDEATDLDCLIVRGPSGALCGYVGVPPAHPWHGRDYGHGFRVFEDDEWHWDDSRIDCQTDVHGGLTYANACQENAEEGKGICHIAAPGREEHIWWFGFDCAHSGDLCPAHERFGLPVDPYESYKQVGYVRREVTKLAAQIANVGPDGLIPKADED